MQEKLVNTPELQLGKTPEKYARQYTTTNNTRHQASDGGVEQTKPKKTAVCLRKE